MRILAVNTADVGGGAERIAVQLTIAARSASHTASLVVGFRHQDRYPWVRAISRNRNQPARNPDAPLPAGPDDRKWALRAGVEDFFYPASWDLLDLADEPPDLIHLHNLHDAYFDLRLLPWLSARFPVVITLHDSWLLTGHCAHPLNCERWRTGCGACPDLSIFPALPQDNTANNWDRKRDILGASRLFVVTPSDWLRRRAEFGLPLSVIRAVTTIPNGVDTNLFRPGDRAAARDRLGLPQDAAVALYVANGGLTNMWRDVGALCDAVSTTAARLAPRRVILLVVGGPGGGNGMPLGNAEVHEFPFTVDAGRLASIYRACDLFVHPARADTFPTVILEAMASGLPVVATAVGGIPEQVVPGETGFLVPPGDGQGMAGALTTLMEEEAMRARLGAAGRHRVLTLFSERMMVDRYLALYADIVAGSGGHHER